MVTNEYGLDHKYFKKKLKAIVDSVESFTPDEMFRTLSSLSLVAAQGADYKVEIKVKFKK